MRRIEARPHKDGLTHREAVNVARRRVVDGEMYLISRHGGWFLPGAHGYCATFADAGVFDAATARSYLDVEGLSVVPLRDVQSQISAEATQLERQAANARALALRRPGVLSCRRCDGGGKVAANDSYGWSHFSRITCPACHGTGMTERD